MPTQRIPNGPFEFTTSSRCDRAVKIEASRAPAKWYRSHDAHTQMTPSSLTPKLEAAVRRELPAGKAVLAISGGLDSMVLLDVAARIGRSARTSLVVATFDHASGANSARAASFVADRAAALALPVVVGRAAASARTEAAWRVARWEFLRSVARSTRGIVFTAHTRDDQVETVLMRALRGAGARGLAALLALSEVRRPFLDLSRADLEVYAMSRGLEWIEDPTNRSPRYLRNRVRRDLLPALRRVCPPLVRDFLAFARRAG